MSEPKDNNPGLPKELKLVRLPEQERWDEGGAEEGNVADAFAAGILGESFDQAITPDELSSQIEGELVRDFLLAKKRNIAKELEDQTKDVLSWLALRRALENDGELPPPAAEPPPP